MFKFQPEKSRKRVKRGSRYPHRHLLIASLFVAPLAIGSFHPLAIGVLAGLLGTSALLVVLDGASGRYKPGFLVFGLGVLAVFTCLQCVPLPPLVQAFVAPASYEAWEGALQLAGSAGSWRPVTVEPYGTVVEVTKLLIVAVTVVLVSVWVRERGRRPVLRSLALVGLVCALVSVVHRLMGLDQVYALYEPQQVHTAFLPAPLLNSNHLAGLLVLTTPISIACGLSESDRGRRTLWLVAGAIMGIAAVLTMSRGGIGALVLAMGILVISVVRRREAKARDWVWAVLGVLVVLAGSAYVAFGAAVEEFATQDNTSKAMLWLKALPLVVAYFPIGSGRGSFISAFPHHSDFDSQRTFTHPENIFVQYTAEWGVLGSVAVVILVVAVVYLVVRGSHRIGVAGAIAGVAGLVAQNFVDFSLELSGVAVPFVAALTAATANRELPWRRFRLRLHPAALLIGLAVALVGSIASLAWASSHSLEVDSQTIRETMLADESRFDASLAQGAVSRHPADYMIPYLAGVWALRDRGQNPLPWLGWALERNPSWAPTHLWTARTLVVAGQESQAMMEYRIAAMLDDRLTRQVANEVVTRWSTYERLRPILEVEPAPAELWDAICLEFERRGNMAEAVRANEAFLSFAPDDPAALERGARAAARSGSYEKARDLAARMPHESIESYLLRAEVESEAGDFKIGAKILEVGLERYSDHTKLLMHLAKCQEDGGQPDAARETYDRLARTTKIGRQGRVLLRRAGFEGRMGRHAEALHLYRQAAAVGAGRPALVGMARAARRTKNSALEREALRRLRDFGHEDRAREREADLAERQNRRSLKSLLERE